MQHEEADRDSEREQALLQEARLDDLALLIELHDLLAQLVCRVELLAVNHDQKSDRHDEDQDADCREVRDEIHELQADGTADHDVRRIADQGRRAADVRRQDLRDEERLDIDVELLRDAERDRHRQKNRRHVIEKSRADGREKREGDEQGDRLRLDLLRRPNGEVVEEPRLARDVHDDHHAHEKAERVEVNVMNRSLLIDDPEKDHEHGAANTNDGAVNLF